MKTRLQLIQGYMNGTLTAKEKRIAEMNHVVMAEVKRLEKSKNKTKIRRKK